MEIFALDAEHAVHKDGNLQWKFVTHGLAYGPCKVCNRFMLVDLHSLESKQRNACFGQRNVRRSLGCFSFCFCFCFCFEQGRGKGIGRIFRFEIPPRYAAVVGKARVCLSLVTSQTRCVMRERLVVKHALYAVCRSRCRYQFMRACSVVSVSVLLRKT